MSVALLVTLFVLYATGTYLLMTRALTRIILGITIFGHGSVLMLMFAAGRPGAPPVYDGVTPLEDYSDPMPQALALTGIVITFGILVFLLALAFRSLTLSGDDQVEDDLEDRLVGAGHFSDELQADQTALERDLDDR